MRYENEKCLWYFESMKFLSKILFYVYFLSKNSWKDIHTQFIKNN